MTRKLKTYVTSIGFYDLAVAAPSMKAALEAWGSDQNLFHQGLAQETNDPDIIAATMASPGLVLRRAVGTNRPYQERAAPPDALPAHAPKKAPAKRPEPARRQAKSDPKAQKAAILSFEQAKAKRDQARQREEAVRAAEQAAAERDDRRRQQAAAKARAVLEKARANHDRTMMRLEKDRLAAEDRIAAEKERWRRQEKKLSTALQDDPES